MVFIWIRLKNAVTLVFWLSAAMVPAAIIALGLLFNDAGGVSIQVGVYGGGENIYGESAWTIVRYEDRERLRQDVSNRRLELGYAFEGDSIILYTSPATVTNRVTNLMVAAALLKNTSGEIGAGVLSYYGIDADAADIQARVDAYLEGGALMEKVVLTYGSGAESEVLLVPFRRLFHGMLALFAQLLAMLCAMGLSGKRERNILQHVKIAGREKLYVFSGFAVLLLLVKTVMVITVLAGALIFPGVWVWQDIFPALIYLFAICSLALILAMTLPEGAFPAVLTMSFIFTALMGGVVFDLREVFEVIAFLRFLFPSHYYMAAIS